MGRGRNPNFLAPPKAGNWAGPGWAGLGAFRPAGPAPGPALLSPAPPLVAPGGAAAVIFRIYKEVEVAAAAGGFPGWRLRPGHSALPALRPSPRLLWPRRPFPLPPPPTRAPPYLARLSRARRRWVARLFRSPAPGPAAMEMPQPEPAAPGSAPSPAGVRGGAQRPGHLPGLRLGAHGLVQSPERVAASSPVATLTKTMHDLAGLGR